MNLPSAPDDAGSRLERLRSWPAAHVQLVDLALAGLLWLLTAAAYLVSYAGLPMGALEMLALFGVATLQTVPLAWRRTRPGPSWALVVLGHVAQLLVADSPMPSNVSAMIAGYAVAAYAPRRVRRAAAVVAVVSGPLAVLDWSTYDEASLLAKVIMSVFISALALVCWLWGDLARRRRELVESLREHNEALRRERDQRARIAAQDERTRIAREMHDIVAHSLSVVVVQADGAAYAAAHADGFGREQASAALTTIGTTAREALAETRRLVGVLRTESDATEYRPAEGLADLPDLVTRVRDSGVDVTLHDSTGGRSVPRETGLAVYRIVQESLTNVIKHAGPAACATVALTADDALHVVVTDDGRGAAASDDGQGHGLIGMQERAASVGGTVAAHPSPGGGFVVTAVLPLGPEESA